MSQANNAATNHQPAIARGNGVRCTLDELILLQYEARKLAAIPKKHSYANYAGTHSSPFKGRGIDFSEVRSYQPGDDVRLIDWRVTARTGKTHTKLFTEERERPVFFTLDLSPSMYFGTQGAFKSVIAATICGLLAWTSYRSRDKVGLLLNENGRHLELKPAGGKKGVLTLLRTIANATHKMSTVNQHAHSPSLKETFIRLKRVARPGSVLFIISDFYGFDREAEIHLSLLAKHASVVLAHIYDPLERNAPPPGIYTISDGKHVTKFNAYDTTLINKVREAFSARQTELKNYALQNAIHYCAFSTSEYNSKHFAKLLYDRMPLLRQSG